MNVDEHTYLVSKRKSEDHLQLILGKRLPGSLFSLSASRPKSRAKFATGTITIPKTTVQAHPEPIEALSKPNGVEMIIPPLGKLYFRPKNVQNQSDNSDLQNQIQQMQNQIHQMELYHRSEIQRLEKAILELGNSVQTGFDKISSDLSTQIVTDPNVQQNMTTPQQQYAVNNAAFPSNYQQQYVCQRDHSRSYSNSPYASKQLPPTAITQQPAPV